MSTYDKNKVESKKNTKFVVNIDGISLFRDSDGRQKPVSVWADCFRKIIFAMSRVPCAWPVDRPRMAVNEITINCTCL